MGGDICAGVRLKYQREPGDPAVLWGTEIPVKMDASRKQKVRVLRTTVIKGRKFLGIFTWPLGK